MTFQSRLLLETEYSEACTAAPAGQSILVAPPGSAIFGARDYASAIAANWAHATAAALA